MLIYFIPFFLFLILAVISPVTPQLLMRVALIVSVAGCVVFVGFRLNSDFDFISYLNIFNQIQPISAGWDAWLSGVSVLYLEPTFSFFVSVFKVIASEIWIFPLVALISLTLYYKAFLRVSAYPATSFLLYICDGFYLREFTQMRFGLAAALGLFSLVALYERRRWMFRLFAGMAVLFHFTALMIFVTEFCIKILSSKRRVQIAATLLFIMVLAGVFDSLIPFIVKLGLAPQRILDHVNTDAAAPVSRAYILISYVILMWMTFIFHEKDRRFFWVTIYAISFSFLCIFSGFDLLRRISFYFSVSLYIVAAQPWTLRHLPFLLAVLVFSIMLLISRMEILLEYQNWLI